MTRRQRRPRGFTLVEVLVALAVVAITLTAGLQASGALTRAATRQTDQWLAQICAENELTRLRLVRQLPGVGDTAVNCEQAGHSLQVQLSVLPTPNPNFRRVDAVVVGPVDGREVRLLTLSTVLGRY
ncbi:MAG: type II secretion system minor pseudopilin GspI [Hydrogenophaga sp.]|uniref:type II secretion system minor pseudopilin GspI n=1 Tax=Hydrogenophaga sp. TaxID=1904254 RepID=UPI00273085C5|nr:type II secretion system minor pseudopilin GspI [Hydrogenophaga sp.]MDP2162665.1 type II secretion system minor pseudopilin GspI [Hydrogenophaga sp.]